jgi:hypothetical protein
MIMDPGVTILFQWILAPFNYWVQNLNCYKKTHTITFKQILCI